jgi:predicted DsbA family dithiol-disulfide isomerase
MSAHVEVFADITCPFAHVGLKRVVEGRPDAEVIVRAWPLEWVNDAGLDFDGVQAKAEALTEQLGGNDFGGLRADHWPTTTLPALDLAAAGYANDAATGLAISLEIRSALFERGLDISDPATLADIAAAHGVTAPDDATHAAVRAEYDDGLARHVNGSPHFWVGSDDFFCPSLDLGRDADGKLLAHIDIDGLTSFFARIDG